MTGNRHDAVEAVRPLPPFKMRCNGSQDGLNGVCVEAWQGSRVKLDE